MELHGPATRALRQRSGLTVTELAKRIGCTQGHLSALENEDRKASPELIVAIARELKLDLPPILRGPLDGMDVTIKPKKRAAA